MSHPVPGHDYSERTKEESSREYKRRKHSALSKAIESKKTPRASTSVKKMGSSLSEMMSSKLPYKEWVAKYKK